MNIHGYKKHLQKMKDKLRHMDKDSLQIIHLERAIKSCSSRIRELQEKRKKSDKRIKRR